MRREVATTLLKLAAEYDRIARAKDDRHDYLLSADAREIARTLRAAAKLVVRKVAV